jgi:hypothetical protein
VPDWAQLSIKKINSFHMVCRRARNESSYLGVLLWLFGAGGTYTLSHGVLFSTAFWRLAGVAGIDISNVRHEWRCAGAGR